MVSDRYEVHSDSRDGRLDDTFDDSLDIAIVGMACRFPRAVDVDEFWHNLRAGRCVVTFFDDDELVARGVSRRLLRDPNYVRAGNPLEDADLFDAELFGIAPREAELMDPQHRVLLECAWTALESAGHDPRRYPGLVGVYAGASTNTYFLHNVATRSALSELATDGRVTIGNSPDFLTTRVSYKLGLEGPSVTVQSACSTSLVAVVMACQSLLAFQCDMAVAGGVAISTLTRDGYLYQPDGLFSPDGFCRPFDRRANGTVGGDGVGLVVLKRIQDAIADRDYIHAVIKGMALNNDGARRAGYTAPGLDSQAATITTALANANVTPDTVDYLEAHGTATLLGDPIELAALNTAFGAFGEHRPACGSCAIGSVKSNIGHLDAAAGVAGLIKTALALEHAEIPPSLHFSEPNPRIDFADGPFRVATELTPWPRTDHPRRAGVSSFGLGGTNAHLVLEQAPWRPAPSRDDGAQLLLLSAATPEALDRVTDGLGDFLRGRPDVPLADVAYTSQVGRTALAHRRVLVAHDPSEAAEVIDARDDGRLLSGVDSHLGPRPVAFMFTGFGAQFPAMAHSLYRQEPVFAEAVDECASILRDPLGTDLRAALCDEPVSDGTPPRQRPESPLELRDLLAEPEPDEHPIHQPVLGYAAMFTVEYALARLWRTWGVVPDAMIGHSLGEYVAACVAEVFSLGDALRLVVARARLIQHQGAGAMVAVSIPAHEVVALLGEDLDLAAVNGPAACVVSGSVAAISRVVQELAAEGVATRRLATRHAFHSALMDPVVDPYAEMVRGVRLRPPRIRFVSNLTGKWITDAEATDPRYWARHLRETVRFADGVATLWDIPDVMLLEVGPGQTLCSAALQNPAARNPATRLPDDRVPDRVVLPSLPDEFGRGAERAVLLRTLGRLWLAGAVIDWSALHAGRPRDRLRLPTYPFERRRYWLEPGERLGGPGSGEGTRRAMGDWFYLPSWRRLGPVRAGALSELAARRWLVFADRTGLGKMLASHLGRLGAPVTVVHPGRDLRRQPGGEFVLDPGRPEHYRTLVERLRETDTMPDRIVHCWGVASHHSDGSGDVDLDETLKLTFHSLLNWAKAGEPELMTSPGRWDVVSTGMYSVTGDESLCPAKAVLQGLCKVAQQEYPSLRCAQFDLGALEGTPLGPVADRLLAELAAPVEPTPVALRGGYRWGQCLVPVPSEVRESAATLRPRGVYLITGGLGRVGLTFAEELVESARARLVLVSRSGLPPRRTWTDPALPADVRSGIDAVRRLEAAGAEVLVLVADVSDERQLAEALDRAVARFGAVNGVLHAAGHTGAKAHRVLTELGDRECAWHLAPKVFGCYALEKALAGRELDFVLLCSSVASLLGGLGFGAYAAANACLDAFAQWQRLRGEPWTAVNWEAWEFAGGRSDGEAEHRPYIGAAIRDMAISPQEGRSVFRTLISMPATAQVAVSTTDLEARARVWATPANVRSPSGPRHTRPTLRNPYVAPSNDVEEQVAEIWRDLLGLDEVGVCDNFFELGGSSLLGLQVVHRIREKMAVATPLTVVYEGPTIRTLARLIAERR